jgi:hypothetical protein
MSPFLVFTCELLADPVFASSAVALRKMLDQLDVEGDGSVDAIEMAKAVEWICNQRNGHCTNVWTKLANCRASRARCASTTCEFGAGGEAARR